MWAIVVLVLLFLSYAFAVTPKSVRSDQSNSTDIFKLIKDSDCGLLSDEFITEIHLKELCSIPLDLKEIQFKSVYDKTPILCSQLYQTNLKLCNLSKLKVINATNVTISHDKNVKQSLNDFQDKYLNISGFCNSIKLTNISNVNDSKIFNYLNDYFTKVMNNHSSCEQLCSNLLDDRITDLCSVIIWHHMFIYNVTQPLRSSTVEGDAVPNLVPQNQVGKPKANEVSTNNAEKIDAKEKSLVDTGPTLNARDDDNGDNTLQDVKISQQTIKEDKQSDIQKNDDVGKISNVQKISDVQKISNVQKISDDIQKKSDDAQKKSDALEKSNNRLDDDIVTTTNKSNDKLNNADPEMYNSRPFEGDVNEGIPETREEKIDESIIQKNDLENNVKSGFADIPENEKATMDLDVNAYRRDRLMENEDSHFFTYFASMGVLCAIMYILFHNKKKILALAVEGRRGRSHGSNRRRPNTASYSKLDCNLEEAMVSNVSQASVTHILY